MPNAQYDACSQSRRGVQIEMSGVAMCQTWQIHDMIADSMGNNTESHGKTILMKSLPIDQTMLSQSLTQSIYTVSRFSLHPEGIPRDKVAPPPPLNGVGKATERRGPAFLQLAFAFAQ
eukprot:454839-Hanusia_phi.AAC.10